MTKSEIIETMLDEEPHRIFRTMQLGGNTRQLEAMEDEGLILSESRGGRGRDRRNWFLSDVQWYRHHDRLHPEHLDAKERAAAQKFAQAIQR